MAIKWNATSGRVLPPRTAKRRGWLFVGLATLALGVALRAAEPKPVTVQTAPGRFEIAAVDSTAAHGVAAAAEDAWRHLASPLGLPDAFPSPIYVRIVPEPVAGAPLFHVTVEPGGIVSVRLVAVGPPTAAVRRAIVQGLLIRLAVARHGVQEKLTAPLWLEHACVAWWITRAEAAQFDSVKQTAARLPPPALTALLQWSRGSDEPRTLSVAAVWLLTFLQAESGRAHEWPALLQRLLAGEEPLAALAACFPERYADAAERELWWRTGYHHARRVRSLPALEIADSQAQLGALARFVFAAPDGERDTVVPLRDVLARRSEPIVAAELTRRAAELERLIPALHPFYRNAGLALAEALRTSPKNAARRATLPAAFEQDWRDAAELAAASAAALDGLEQRLR